MIMNKNTFDRFWLEVQKSKVLPNTAVQQLPGILSEKVKTKLLRIEFDQAIKMIVESIDEINHGSVESVNSILERKLSVK